MPDLKLQVAFTDLKTKRNYQYADHKTTMSAVIKEVTDLLNQSEVGDIEVVSILIVPVGSPALAPARQ